MLFGVNEGDFVLKVSVAAILAAEEDWNILHRGLPVDLLCSLRATYPKICIAGGIIHACTPVMYIVCLIWDAPAAPLCLY